MERAGGIAPADAISSAPAVKSFIEELHLRLSDVDPPADLERVRQNAHLYTAAPLGAAQSGEIN